jgi:hypothetical protein
VHAAAHTVMHSTMADTKLNQWRTALTSVCVGASMGALGLSTAVRITVDLSTSSLPVVGVPLLAVADLTACLNISRPGCVGACARRGGKQQQQGQENVKGAA